MENLYDYAFWFNSYEDVWYAIPRDKWTLFFSGKEDKHKMEGVYRSSEIDTLIAVINNPDIVQFSEEDVIEDDDRDDYENWPDSDHWGE
jgi:hypothetical protein